MLDAIVCLQIYWFDADSGRLPDGARFRLHGVDAPETRSPNSPNGAKCESERDLGYLAKEAMVSATRDKDVLITYHWGWDSFGRMVVDIAADGVNPAYSLIEQGHLKPWDYDGGQPKPDWCE